MQSTIAFKVYVRRARPAGAALILGNATTPEGYDLASFSSLAWFKRHLSNENPPEWHRLDKIPILYQLHPKTRSNEA